MARPVLKDAILEATFVQSEYGQQILNVFHYVYDGSPVSPADGDDVADKLADVLLAPAGGLRTLAFPQFAVDWRFENLRLQWITPQRYTPVVRADGAGPGENPEAPIPQNVASVFTKRSVLAGRHGVGSSHWAGLVVTDTINGAILPGRVTTMTQIADIMSQPLDLTGITNAVALRPVIWDRAVPTASRLWTDFTVQATVRVMRRRTVGVGV